MTRPELDAVRQEAEAAIEAAIQFATASPAPQPGDLARDVYTH